MIYGEWKTCLIDISESATTSLAVDLGRPYDFMTIELPTITNAQITVQTSKDAASTYQNLYTTDLADGSNSLLKNGTSTGGIAWQVPLGGFQYIKLLSSANQLTTDKSIKIRGGRY
jgi:hypothetical protein